MCITAISFNSLLKMLVFLILFLVVVPQLVKSEKMHN